MSNWIRMLLLMDFYFFIFFRLGSELIPQKQLKEEAETIMEHLKNLVQYTAVSFHNVSALIYLQT